MKQAGVPDAMESARGFGGHRSGPTVYVTDISKLLDHARVKPEYIPGEQPALTAIGMASLALPAMMIEVDATAVLSGPSAPVL